MFDMTYDPQADAVYLYVGAGEVDHTEEAGPFSYDIDGDGRIVGIEILAVSRVLAPGAWLNARRPGTPKNTAAE